MKRLVIFDGNHLLYRAYYKFMNLKTLEGVKTSIIYGTPYIIESLIRRLSPTKVIATFDGDRSEYRLKLLPNYKNRQKRLGWDAEDFHRQKDAAIVGLQCLGIPVVMDKKLEADDVIAMVARRYEKKGYEVIIVSADKDFNQLIEKNISVFNVKNNQMLTLQNLQSITGYKPEQCVDYLSLLGDSSDKIPGYNGIGDKKALNLLDIWGSIQNFLISEDNFGKIDKIKLKELAKLNKKLIDLKFYYRKFLMKKAIPYLNPNTKLDEEGFKLYCKVHETNSFLKKQFYKTYKNLYYGI